jgi:hypothetical protein
MNTHLVKLSGLLSLALTLAFISPQRAAADDNDPPGRVARLGYAHGSVSFQPGGTDEWVDARINRPMTTGDRLWADAGALAEMNTGSAYIRIGSNTGFSFLNLSDEATQIQLTQGTILVRVRRMDQNEAFEIDTPNLAFSIYLAGVYKVTVNDTGVVTVVQVRQGEGGVTGGGATYELHQGDQGRFAGTDGLEAEMSNYQYRGDAFETWSSQRDIRIDHSYSSKYVSPDVIGYEDLDQNGGWRPSAEYGNVWYPHTTVVGWAPYHNGHWAYIAPWGYTWVDDEPWGFAPFHYGRWVNVEGAWGWVPGPRQSEGEVYVRPVYAPALVAWVGGAHFAVGVSVGGGGGYSQGESVGWFPLGPREVYVPSYPVSRTYVNNVNVSNTNVTNTVVNNYYNTTVVNNTNNRTNVNVTNVKYVNQAVPGAVTATTGQAFVSAQPVAKNVVQVNQHEIATAPVRFAAPPVAPTKEAVLGTTVRAPAKPPEAVVNRTVVAKAPPPPPPVPFVQQQKAIEANGGKPLPGSEIHQMQVKEQQQVQRSPQAPQQRTPSGQPGPAPAQVQQTPQQAVRIAPPVQPQNAHPAPAQTSAPNQPAATPNNQQQNNRPANQNAQQQPPQAPAQQSNRPGQPVAVSPNEPNAANNPPNSNRPNNQSPPARAANAPDPALELKHQQELEQLHKQQDQERQRVEQQQLQERKVQEQKAAELQSQQHKQQAQSKADLQQQQDRKVQEQKVADQLRPQQQQQAQRLQEQKAVEQQRQQQQQQAQKIAEQQQQQIQRAADQQRQQLALKHEQDLKQLEEKHAQEQQQLNQKHEQQHQLQARPEPPPAQKQPPPAQQRQQQSQPPPPQAPKDKPKKDVPPPPRS